MKKQKANQKACPGCGGTEHTTLVRKDQAVHKCTNCGYQRSARNTTPSFVIAKPEPRVPEHATHPHHYVAIMLGFFLVGAMVVIFSIARLH